jgi:hypothetical protein
MSEPSSHIPGIYARSHRPDPQAVPFTKSVMLGKRRSSSASSIDVPYHALPQTPDMAQEMHIPSAIAEADLSSEDIEDVIGDETTPSDAPVDNRIQWIHFMLGAAVLLPWNGRWMASCLLACHVNSYDWQS